VCCGGTIYDIRSSVIGGFSSNLFFARKSFCPLAHVGRYIGRDRWEETGRVKRASEIKRERKKDSLCVYERQREREREKKREIKEKIGRNDGER